MKKSSFFWVSFSDLMVSLFFIMLVLFILAIGYMQNIIRITQDKINKIEEIQESTRQLPEEFFSYQPNYKRYKLNKQIQFPVGRSEIQSEYFTYLISVGQSIDNLINKLKSDPKYKEFDIKYLVVIEGMASKDNFEYNFELSYSRALSLYKFWEENGIKFDPEICEVQIAGSGTEGLREFSGPDEFKNQQFLIHIVPKIGRIADES